MDDWQIDVESQKARHSSGLELTFEGRPRTKHFSGSPSRVPEGVQSLELVRLIREGYQAFEAAWPEEGGPHVAQATGKPQQEEGSGVKVSHRRRRKLSRSNSPG
ncbi:MAG: hypothetical protein R6W87_06670 [Halospina sp.]